MNLVTGYRGYAHVTSNDHAALHRAVFGAGHCIINTGSVFALTFADTDVVRISDGEAVIQGHHMRIAPGDHDDVQLTAGTAGNNRIDYIAIRYTKSAEGIESAAIVQICGSSVSGTPSPPALTQQDTSENGTVYEAALYRIAFTGLAIGTPVAVFTPVYDIQTQISKLAAALQSEISATRQEAERNLRTVQQEALLNLNNTKQNLQSQINGKQATVTGGASSITSGNLTASRALISNSSGKVDASGITAAELGYLAGLNGNVKTQLDAIKAVLNGCGSFLFKSASANVASSWKWGLKKFDNAASISSTYGNLTSSCSGGYWIPPSKGFIIVSAVVTFASNSKGARCARLAIINGTSVTRTGGTLHVMATNHTQTISAAAVFKISATEKLGLEVMQESGSTLAVSAECRLLFIPDM